ncbi:ATP-binding protein [Methylobacterium sp. WL69]|uniref:AlbA family DNA-binding domain-containing protein n=1 Tax=Methylobacterium sp. WL69 TaxID=2603893 RepID=UPI00164F00DC|nr:ATP-binding protein [Methylobacterium sp. WL69]
MRALFEQLLDDGEAGIERLIVERAQENVQLDFKTKKNALRGTFEDEDRKVFGKALSALANSAGGLLVYGITAKKGADDIDCAQAPAVPIAEIERFKSEAIRAAGDLLMPRYDGISIDHIPTVADPTSGYLLIYVERSDRRPHRCEAKGEKQYYKRAGDSSFAMEHYDIEDAFSRTKNPTISVEYILHGGGVSGPVIYKEIRVDLVNNSDVIAKYPYIKFSNMHCVNRARFTPTLEGFTLTSEADGMTVAGSADVVVHPHCRRTIFWLEVAVSSLNGVQVIGEESAQTAVVGLLYQAGCEGSKPVRGEKVWYGRELFPPN